MVVRPFRSPGKNYQKHAHNRAHKHKHEDGDAMQPQFESHVAFFLGRWWWRYGGRRLAPMRRGDSDPERTRRNSVLRWIRIRGHRMLPIGLSIAACILPTHVPSVREY